MNDILTKIVATKCDEIAKAKSTVSYQQLRSQVSDCPPTRDFVAALSGGTPIRLIAEVKKASPSAGMIRPDFDAVQVAKAYQQGGASCLSVLTDVQYFQGSLAYLGQIKQHVDLPLLRKDFIVDPYQVVEARVHGADAILLIAECLEAQQLKSLHDLARDLSMAVLVELHDPALLPKVLASGTQLVGVNNRDLHDFSVDAHRTAELRQQIPADRILVGESGVCSRQQVVEWQDAGVNAMLVGQTLMQQADIEAGVRQLLGL